MPQLHDFVTTWENEFRTNLRVFAAFPAERLDYRPHEVSKTAHELMWVIASEEGEIVDGCLKGKITWGAPKPPKTVLTHVRTASVSIRAFHLIQARSVEIARIGRLYRASIAMAASLLGIATRLASLPAVRMPPIATLVQQRCAVPKNWLGTIALVQCPRIARV